MGEKKDIRKEIKRVFIKQLNQSIHPKSRNTFSSLNVSEVDLVNLKCPLELSFQISIQLEDIRNCQTPYDVKNLVEAAIEKRDRERRKQILITVARPIVAGITALLFGYPSSL